MNEYSQENINKPVTVIRAEFISNLADVINNSSLPPFIIEPILKDMYLETKAMANKQYEHDREQYEAAIVSCYESENFPMETEDV